MSGRGTIKAGTYGGRRYREKRERKIKELKEEEKKFQKALKEVSQPVKVKDPSQLKRAEKSKTQLVKKYRGVLNPEGEEVDIRPVAPSGLDRDIQLAVNTIPIRVDARYIMKIREALAQQEEQADENPEDRDDGWDVADTQNALHMHGGGHAEEGVEDEEGDIQLGAEGRAQPDRVEEALPDWADVQPDPSWQEEPVEGLMGQELDDLADEMLDFLSEEEVELSPIVRHVAPMDEEEAFANKLDAVYDRGAGQIGDMHVRDKIQAQLKSKEETAERPEVWGGVSGGYERVHKWSEAGGSAFLGGLAPELTEEGHGLDYYKKDKKGKVKIGAKGMAPTDEYKALLEGRVMDERPGMSGKDIISGTRSRAIGEGKKQKEYKERMGWGDKPKKESGRPFLMEERDPKTRKKTGKIVERQLTLAGHKHKIEEKWGLERKGMSRDPTRKTDREGVGLQYGEQFRDAWEGRRAIAKEPGKQFTKRKEAETKHKLYEKTRREEDPEYRPRDLTGAKAGFGYGSGMGLWDTGKDAKQKVLQNVGGHSVGGTKVQQTSDDFNVAELPTGISTEELEALKSYVPQSAKMGKAFPGAENIYAPRSMINPTTGVSEWRPSSNITNPPMADAQATNPSTPMPGGNWRSGGFGKPSEYKWKDKDPFAHMVKYDEDTDTFLFRKKR